MPRSPQTHSYEANAILRVSEECEERIKAFLFDSFRVKRSRLQSNLHLTVYHGRRVLPYLRPLDKIIRITGDAAETKFMALEPGGENPRKDIDPKTSPLGIRLTRRNSAIPEIQKLRRQLYQLENKKVIGTRHPTTAWKNCFGSRNYQPHIQILRPWHKIDCSLSEIGECFRAAIEEIEFDRFQIEERHRVDGQWVIGRATRPGAAWTQLFSPREASQFRNTMLGE
jgi:hypothetical protein